MNPPHPSPGHQEPSVPQRRAADQKPVALSEPGALPKHSAAASPTTTALGTKAQLRSGIRAARRELSPEERQRRDQAIQARLLEQLMQRFGEQRPVIAAFSAMTGEPGGQELPEVLAQTGFEVLLPVVRSRTRELEWRYYLGPEHLRANSMGILQPTGPEAGPLHQLAALAVLPALALGADGTRLGQGGGFYDKQFSDPNRQVEAIWALVDDAELLPSVPALEHDLSVDAAITPRGVQHFPGV